MSTSKACPLCGYLMEPFDTGCRRCKGVGLPKATPEPPEPASAPKPRRVWWGKKAAAPSEPELPRDLTPEQAAALLEAQRQVKPAPATGETKPQHYSRVFGTLSTIGLTMYFFGRRDPEAPAFDWTQVAMVALATAFFSALGWGIGVLAEKSNRP